jgi:hypothetical protein
MVKALQVLYLTVTYLGTPVTGIPCINHSRLSLSDLESSCTIRESWILRFFVKSGQKSERTEGLHLYPSIFTSGKGKKYER